MRFWLSYVASGRVLGAPACALPRPLCRGCAPAPPQARRPVLTGVSHPSMACNTVCAPSHPDLDGRCSVCGHDGHAASAGRGTRPDGHCQQSCGQQWHRPVHDDPDGCGAEWPDCAGRAALAVRCLASRAQSSSHDRRPNCWRGSNVSPAARRTSCVACPQRARSRPRSTVAAVLRATSWTGGTVVGPGRSRRGLHVALGR